MWKTVLRSIAKNRCKQSVMGISERRLKCGVKFAEYKQIHEDEIAFGGAGDSCRESRMSYGMSCKRGLKKIV